MTINSVTSPSFNSSIVACSEKCEEFFNDTISEIRQFISPDLHECLRHLSHSNQVVGMWAQSLLWLRSQKKYGSMQMQIFTQFEIRLDLSSALDTGCKTLINSLKSFVEICDVALD